jgi:methionine biosynthesis protein MetW
VRSDLQILEQWIKPRARVLDLGCGDGELLSMLVRDKQIDGLGLEIDADNITKCFARGLSVIEQDIDNGLTNFIDNSFDTVVLTQTLQAVMRPDLVLDEMLRVGNECIITFPNFGHWRCRLHVAVIGRMPVSKFMPYQWYDTPNTHFCTVRDFEILCAEKHIRVVHKAVINFNSKTTWIARRWPNLFGVTAIYHVTK